MPFQYQFELAKVNKSYQKVQTFKNFQNRNLWIFGASAATYPQTDSHPLYAIGVDDFDVVSAANEDGGHQVPHTLKQITIFILGQNCHHH